MLRRSNHSSRCRSNARAVAATDARRALRASAAISSSARLSFAPVRNGPTSSAMTACRRATIAAVLRVQVPLPRRRASRSSAARSILRPASLGRVMRLRARGGAPAGAAAEHQRFGDGVAGQPVGAVGAADHFAGDEQAGHVGRHVGVGFDATHVVMRDRRHLDRHAGEIDAVCGEPVDHRPERRAQRRRASNARTTDRRRHAASRGRPRLP